jgi:hypothetical protein
VRECGGTKRDWGGEKGERGMGGKGIRLGSAEAGNEGGRDG